MDNIIPPNTPQKQCKRCKQVKDASSEFFHVDRSRADGWLLYCKVCISTEHAKKEKLPDGYRRCGACKEVMPLSPKYFVPDLRREGKFYYPCRTCMNKKNLARHYAHREEHLQVSKAYYQRFSERIKERHRLTNHARYIAHRDEYKAYSKAHQEQRTAHQRNRLARKKAGGSHTVGDIEQQYKNQKGKCYYCSKKLDKYHVDHVIPLSRGGSNDPSNLVVTCPTCNLRKRDKLPHEWNEGGKLM